MSTETGADGRDAAAFRAEIREWLAANLTTEFDAVRGRGGPGDEHVGFEPRLAWERRLAAGGWTCIGWPERHGGRGATLAEQVVFHEELARARAPARVGIVGEGLLGPTVMAFGTEEQKQRFLGPIVAAEELWCQGYSEPGAGSDLAGVATKAVRDGDEWVVTGQKVWTSLAHWSDWCFVLCRTDPDAAKHRGLSYLLVPMRQPGVEIRPIVQLTGTSEFNEVFFDGARTALDHVVGGVNDGWKVAMGTLAFERGASTLGQQVEFAHELEAVTDAARARGATKDPVIRQRLAGAWIGLRILRYNALRTLHAMEGDDLTREGMITKLSWASWHRDLGELGIDVLGPDATVTAGPGNELGDLQRLFLWSRADTIYGGTNEIQRNVIGERALGLPRETRQPPK